MTSPGGGASGGLRPSTGAAIQRLLFVADAAVADVEELPSRVREFIDAAAEVYVVTPSLPGRLAWFADEIDRSRHLADERLDTVVGHLRSLGAHTDGAAAGGSVLTVIADAVAHFEPDHILIALRSPEHANWQERGLIARIEDRFALPVLTYAVDDDGHTSTADGPLLLCYDGSRDARSAIQRAGRLFDDQQALVVMVWQPSAGFAGLSDGIVDFVEFDRAAAEHAANVAEEGVRIARLCGLRAKSLGVVADGPVWKTLVEIADHHDAAIIVVGSRGLSGVRAMLLGSVSAAVVQHASRPTMVIRAPLADG